MTLSLKKPGKLFLILLLVPFCKPVGLECYPWLNRIFYFWKLAALAYFVGALLPRCIVPRPKKTPTGFLCLGLFWLIYFANCIRSGVDVISIGTAAVSCAFLLLLISYEIRVGNGMLLLQAMTWLFTGCILAHALSVPLTDLGLLSFGRDAQNTQIYLFGTDNYSAFFLYPMLSVSLFYHHLRYGRIRFWGWGLSLTVTLTYLYTASMTAAGAGMLMIAVLLIQKCWKHLRDVLRTKWVLAGLALLLILICVFNIQNVLASFLNVLGKGLTLNSRTIIWDRVIRLFRQKPLFGHGNFTAEQIQNYILYGTNHAHNLLMELLLRTGLIGTAAYVLFLCGFASSKKERMIFRSSANVLLIGLIVQLVLSFMDFYPTILVFYCFMGCLYHANQFCKKEAIADDGCRNCNS